MSEVIRLLPDHIANQIAAGEVIQRPASVLKELVENAIDAGADEIEVHIKDAGKTLIQVIDNGSGMSEMDARMAFERHATSKVRTAADLFDLHTKGFRGEALASIAAIAHVSLKTRLSDAELGTQVDIEGSKISNQSPCTCKPGTSFEIKNLFYNMPARRNFLKSDAVEFKHLEEEFLRIALAHSDLKLSLSHNESYVFQLPKSNLRQRIVHVFGKSYDTRLVPISEQTDIVKIEGFICKPEFAKKSRGEQYFFVNGRFFKHSYYNHAITQAYDNLLAPKTFPSYFLFFTVNPASIDVNVHPTKTEIKFEEEREIYAVLRSTVKSSLGKFNIAPGLDFERETSFDLPYEMRNQEVVPPQIQVDTTYNPFQTTTNYSSGGRSGGNSKAISNAGFGQFETIASDWDDFKGLDDIKEEETVVQTSIETNSDSEIKNFLFQGNFFISNVKSGLLFMHYKRANERIVYDELMHGFMHNPINSQQMLFPIEIELRESEKMPWEENRKTLERCGFSWETSPTGISVHGAPAFLDDNAIQESISQVHQKMIREQFDKSELAHEVILSIAKANANRSQAWNKESANALLEKLFQCAEHQYSPSGKLIIHILSNEEINSKF